MADRNSYISQILPRKRSVQNLLGSLPPLNFVSYISTKLDNNKQLGRKTGAECRKKSSAARSQDIVLERINEYTSRAREFVFGKPDCHRCIDSVHKYKSLQSKSTDLDPGDFYHAMKNSCENVPHCSQEPYIHNGYVLPFMPWRYYLKVLWIPNNEMFNVWTHLLPSLYFMWLLYGFNQTIDLLDAWPLLLVTSGAIMLTFFSALAHTFHSRSNYHHCCWFIVDYFGITMFAFCSILSHFYASAELSYYSKIGWYNLLIFLIICWIGFFCCALSQTGNPDTSVYGRHFKIWSNVIGYFYGILPLAYRFFFTNKVHDPAMMYHILQFVFMLVSPMWYASDLPQRLWPGKFDIIGHSHQIFHIFGALGNYFDICATHMDVTSGHMSVLKNQADYPTLTTVATCICILACCCILTGRYFFRNIQISFRKELDFLHQCPCAMSSLFTNNNNNVKRKKVT